MCILLIVLVFGIVASVGGVLGTTQSSDETIFVNVTDGPTEMVCPYLRMSVP